MRLLDREGWAMCPEPGKFLQSSTHQCLNIYTNSDRRHAKPEWRKDEERSANLNICVGHFISVHFAQAEIRFLEKGSKL